MSIIVNNYEFTIEIQPEMESAIDAASQICSLGDRIGVSSDQMGQCVEDIVLHIREKYTKALAASRADSEAAAAQSRPAADAPQDQTMPIPDSEIIRPISSGESDVITL